MSAKKPAGKPEETSSSEKEAPAKKGGKKKLVVFLAAVLLLAGVGAGLWFTGILPPLLGMGREEHTAGKEGAAAKPGDPKAGEGKLDAEEKPKLPVFVEIPDLVANLNVGQRRSSFIKLKARMEIARAEDMPIIQASMPRLQDLFTTYLREVRPEELRGSAGTYRLREELLARANIATAPARVVDVLFTEMLVQ
jgi:flagellar FliL protein